jgi:ABC-type glutathione transport system ATPase component
MLRVEHLSKVYNGGPFSGKKTTALEDISFDLKRGEVLGIVGESGSGKTTLANILLRAVAPDEGRVLLDGNDLFGKGRMPEGEFRKKVQMITQNFSDALHPDMTVQESIKEVQRIFGKNAYRSVSEADVIRTLGDVGLGEELLHRRPAQLSGGQLQRVLIARVVSLKPALIIADEPTSCLDTSIQARIIRLLMALKREYAFTMIFISHDVALTAAISDRIAVMRGGLMVETGDSTQVIKTPRDAYTRRFVRNAMDSVFSKKEPICLAV